MRQVKGIGTLLLLFFLLAGKAQPLAVGDRCPDFRLAQENGRPPVRLSGYRGKLVLLELWRPFCHASINTIPVLDSLQQAFAGKLQVVFVTGESQKTMEAALRTFRITTRSNWPWVVNDSVIAAAFPYQAVPHIIWIDTTGTIRAITGAEYLRPENIETVYSGKKISWPVKTERVGYDYTQPLLQVADNGAGLPRPAFYATVTGYLDGVPRKLLRDTGAAGQRLCLLNFSILELYKNALKFYPTLRFGNRLFLRVRDTGRFRFTAGTAYRAEWIKNHFYCYESRSPLNVSEEEQYNAMRHDLDRFFGLESRIKKRRMTCLVLKKAGGKPPALAKEGQDTETTFLYTLQYALAANANLPPFVNETGLPDEAALPFSSGLLQNLPELKKALKKSGLTLTEEKREIDVFILIEK